MLHHFALAPSRLANAAPVPCRYLHDFARTRSYLDAAHILDRFDQRQNVSLSETMYDELLWLHGTSVATVIPFAIAPTYRTWFGIGEITQGQGISAVSQQ